MFNTFMDLYDILDNHDLDDQETLEHWNALYENIESEEQSPDMGTNKRSDLDVVYNYRSERM